VVELAGALIVVLDHEGRIVFFNRACEAATGYSAAEMKGKHTWDILLPRNEIEHVQGIFAQHFTGGAPSQHENHWVARDGKRRLISWTSTAITDERGEVEYVIGAGTDVTEKREVEGELQRRSHELGERVKELRCLYEISRLREQSDLPLGDLLQRVAELIPPAWQYPEITCARITLGDQEYATAGFKTARWLQAAPIVAQGEQLGQVEVYYLEQRPKLAEGPFLAEERHLLDVVAERLGRIVEHTRDEEQLTDYQWQLRRLASELSLSEERERRRVAVELHDGVGQLLALIKIKLAGQREAGEDGGLLEVLALVDQAIAQTRSLTFELSPLVLHELGFEAALEWLAAQLRDQLKIEVEFRDDGLEKVLSEELQVALFQAARELLHNVAKHAQASRVTVSVQREDGQMRVSVADDGVGFNPVEQAQRRGTQRGFGLFSIRERLRHLGGRAEITSAPGRGTQVSLSAPLVEPAALAGARPVPAAAQGPLSRIRVLLVDDQQITRQGLLALLERHDDLEVVAEAATGEQAVQLAQRHRPDVVVMDVAMPGMNGIEATRRITETLPRSKVIALSMHSDSQFVLEMLRAGAVGYLLKDCAQEDLVQAIRAVNAQLTFFSPSIADDVIANYMHHHGVGREAVEAALTQRELEVLGLLAEGLTTKQIATRLQISVKTVESHRQHTMEKLNLRSMAELTKFAIRHGLTEVGA
jgi:PAS domain S-box-containing protein